MGPGQLSVLEEGRELAQGRPPVHRGHCGAPHRIYCVRSAKRLDRARARPCTDTHSGGAQAGK